MVTIGEVREELGSPSQDDIADDTLARLIDEEKTLYGSAYRGALIIARKYAFESDYSRGNVRESLSQISRAWRELADELKLKAMTASGTMPMIGSGRQRISPDFWRGMFDDDYT